ncbi:hypothetical protein Riv7116_0748 [Rivularia sp. PCC 7116]|uniref:DUF4870 domain-containing protein n=1 Tax=Rivularia sp. PCC 7116 TaxID=373994 RepID=UPI00029F1044|nr:DUF4870 domain-containing protein [Rivularia sp. PCC 7116]AFY53335.1 hypothetical protein Riv7116_0748 [Rivularia sp. PCC 7116]
MENIDRRKLLSAICHGAILFSSMVVTVAAPIVILFTTEDSIVKANARESLNFHINLYTYVLVFYLVFFLAIGIGLPVVLLIVLSLVLWLVNFIMPTIALIHVLNSPNQPYRYPFIFRLVS